MSQPPDTPSAAPRTPPPGGPPAVPAVVPHPPGRPVAWHPGSPPPGLPPRPEPVWTDTLPWVLPWSLVVSALCFVLASAGAVLEYVWCAFLVAITFGMVYDDPEIEAEFSQVFAGARISEALREVAWLGLTALPGTAVLGIASWFVFRAFSPSKLIAGFAVLPGVLLALVLFVGGSLNL